MQLWKQLRCVRRTHQLISYCCGRLTEDGHRLNAQVLRDDEHAADVCDPRQKARRPQRQHLPPRVADAGHDHEGHDDGDGDHEARDGDAQDLGVQAGDAAQRRHCITGQRRRVE